MSDLRQPDGDDNDARAFRRAREVFESALEWPAADRSRRVRDAAGGDEALGAVVERMLQADAAPHRLLDGGLPLSSERLRAGDAVGTHLRVVGLLGRGGMGEVYRAHDAALGRDVALKILGWSAGDGGGDRERLARLQREAQILASLNHPNIAAIYGIEEWPSAESGTALIGLVLELVDGPTLADRLAAGRMELDEAVRVGRQIAEALEAAHARGIVHRDLKPANVALRPDGVVKLLDFGLAKIAAPPSSPLDAAAASPTITNASIAPRALLGTPAYMSPEQARGHDADARSDIWAFGAVLFEMLSGTRAFPGDDATGTLGAVLHHDVDWTALDPSTPVTVRALLARCLDRDARRRLRDVGEARIVLEDPDAGSLPVPGIRSRAAAPAPRRLAAFILPALAAGALALVVLWPRATLEVGPVSRFAIATTAATALDVDPQSGDLALTPDGRHIVYKGGPRDRVQLFVRALDRLEPVALTPPGRPKAPFSSPDGQWIGFFEPGGGGPRLEKVAITGGRPIDVCRIDGASRGASWGADGAIVFATAAPATGLQRIAASGGEPEVLTRPARDRGESDHLWPQILPGGRTVLFTIVAVTGGMDASQIAVLDLPSRTWKTVLRGGRQAQYVSSGHLVYVVGDALWAVPFDLTALETRGPAAMVVEHVLTLPTGTAEFDVAPGGTLLFATGRPLPSRRTLVWVDRRGHAEAIAGAAQRPYAAVRLSPDGSRVALEIADEDNDIWVWDLARQTMTRVTTDPGLDQGPVWMPDGHRLLFTSQTGGVPGALFRQSADGTGTAERLTDGTSVQRASAVLPDGTAVLFYQFEDLMLLPFDGAQRPRPVVRTPQLADSGVVSPDDRWLAYVERDAGPPQVFVRPFPNVDGARVQVSVDGGTQPVWARNSRELFYLGRDGSVMSAAVAAGTRFSAATPQRVVPPGYFDGRGLTAPRTYDVSPDGRFLMIKADSAGEGAAEPAADPRMIVVLNWSAELARVVPTR